MEASGQGLGVGTGVPGEGSGRRLFSRRCREATQVSANDLTHFLQRDTLDRDTVSEAAAVATPGFLLLRSPLPRAIARPYLIVSLSRGGMNTTLGREGAFQWWG